MPLKVLKSLQILCSTNMVSASCVLQSLCVFLFSGEDGRLAYEQLDTVPREIVRLGTRRGNAVTTSF